MVFLEGSKGDRDFSLFSMKEIKEISISSTVKLNVLMATSVKQATCLKRPVFWFQIVTVKYNFTCRY